MNYNKTLTPETRVLPVNNINSYLYMSLFLILAVALPSVCHLLKLPVRYILPMHWTVILAGLVYGWRGGFVSGFLSPLISFLITGMPYPAALLPMTAELSVYGASSGFLREKLNLNSFASVAIALIFGRAVYLLIYFMLSSGIGYSEYLFTSMVPGLAGGIMQIVLLPLAAKLWIK